MAQFPTGVFSRKAKIRRIGVYILTLQHRTAVLTVSSENKHSIVDVCQEVPCEDQ